MLPTFIYSVPKSCLWICVTTFQPMGANCSGTDNYLLHGSACISLLSHMASWRMSFAEFRTTTCLTFSCVVAYSPDGFLTSGENHVGLLEVSGYYIYIKVNYQPRDTLSFNLYGKG
ncbi:hypothetical protein F4774DRAFT_367155 [Daldinia eschscholtzii]|nr:hypothetical protein F4774DRAFT_367155 [Daldinia eschscholtzii]